MHRKIFALILGMIMCQAMFSLLALTAMQLWPNYAIHAHRYLDQRIFTFTSIMACMNLIFWVFGFIGAGWTTARIALDSRYLWALIGLMQAYAIYVHLLRSWSIFPWWYNLVIVLSIVPATVLGGLFARAPADPLVRRCRLVSC